MGRPVMNLEEAGNPPTEVQKELINQVNRNAQIEKRISGLGIELTSVGAAKNQFFMQWIINNLLTQAQRDDMMLAWAQEYGKQLIDLEGKARELKMASERPRLVQPGAPGLIVPGNVRRSRS
jgi:hypothetical protein